MMTGKCQPMRVNTAQTTVIHGSCEIPPRDEVQTLHETAISSRACNDVPMFPQRLTNPYALMQWESENL